MGFSSPAADFIWVCLVIVKLYLQKTDAKPWKCDFRVFAVCIWEPGQAVNRGKGKFEVLTSDKGSRAGRFVGHPLDTPFGRN